MEAEYLFSGRLIIKGRSKAHSARVSPGVVAEIAALSSSA